MADSIRARAEAVSRPGGDGVGVDFRDSWMEAVAGEYGYGGRFDGRSVLAIFWGIEEALTGRLFRALGDDEEYAAGPRRDRRVADG